MVLCEHPKYVGNIASTVIISTKIYEAEEDGDIIESSIPWVDNASKIPSGTFAPFGYNMCKAFHDVLKMYVNNGSSYKTSAPHAYNVMNAVFGKMTAKADGTSVTLAELVEILDSPSSFEKSEFNPESGETETVISAQPTVVLTIPESKIAQKDLDNIELDGGTSDSGYYAQYLAYLLCMCGYLTAQETAIMAGLMKFTVDWCVLVYQLLANS